MSDHHSMFDSNSSVTILLCISGVYALLTVFLASALLVPNNEFARVCFVFVNMLLAFSQPKILFQSFTNLSQSMGFWLDGLEKNF